MEAKFATLPCGLNNKLAQVNLVCAVTDQLNVDVDYFLPKDDYNRLLDEMRDASAMLLSFMNVRARFLIVEQNHHSFVYNYRSI